MDLGLAGRLAVVTGASKGIGLEVTTALTDEGVHVVAGSRSRGPELATLEDAGLVTYAAVDLSTPEGPIELINRAEELGGVDILVNNAGAVTPRPDGFISVTDEQWLASWTLGVMATVRTTRAAIPQLIRRGGGSVVTVGSVNAFLPDPGVVDYSAVKAAVTNLCKSLSKEYGAQNIRVNTISPGPVATSLWLGKGGVAESIARAAGGSADDVAQHAAAESVTGRFTTPQEVADLVVYLASDRSANVTGADFTIDGGLITTL
ncbi:SDR family NAD(P)-dependent oxidoreductase [Gordonia sp. SL306]|uniref:SDR family NAD(P)-dependent oxidoreductase n=1 Tax=Gordonia sp. SL306 TaxID=2995145 RepID=UPI00226E141B|nr:SDR family oxidoreductase [Gordonia sp. SL306]WAC55527.1 SDR family oxidoreductase [Gordonia sp. SL306]